MSKIKQLFSEIGSKINSWLYGRYGYDELNRFLSICGLCLLILSLITASKWSGVSNVLCWLALVLYVAALFRMYSRSIAKRSAERDRYLRLTAPIRKWWGLQRNKFADRKTHRYFKCKQCKAVLRVPKGKGKIKICCRNCGAELIKKT